MSIVTENHAKKIQAIASQCKKKLSKGQQSQAKLYDWVEFGSIYQLLR